MARRTGRAPVTGVLDWAVAERAQPGETASGDLAVVQPFPGGVLAAVVDALGHGGEAATTARQAITALERVPSEPVADLLRRCHEALLGFRGAVVSLASFDTLHATMTWLGVGNVEGVLLLADQTLQPSRTTLVTFGGIVGAELPRARAWIVPVSPGDTLIFATDGIRTGFADDLVPTGSPQQIADGILARHAKGTDDALVLVARYIGGERRTR
jgi:negative regulator of sigma-B (phosphoserine phosphatase)